jgi:hypothetical protein
MEGGEIPVEAVFADAQYRTTEVYEMAVADDGIIPITGAARTGVAPWSTATHYPKSDKELDRTIDVLNCNDRHFKDMLLRRFASGVTEEGFDIAATDWVLPRNTPREFLRHMLGEIVVQDNKLRGSAISEWRKVGPNDYLDNAKYALAARYVLTPNLRELAAANSMPGVKLLSELEQES